MEVTLNKEPKWSKIDHLFVVLAENEKHFPIRSLEKLYKDAGFKGRDGETITLLAGEPRKVTLIGAGKKDALTMRGVRAALFAIGKIAKKHRDRSIAVSVPYDLPDLESAEATRVVADFLSQADYKYDTYITKKDDDGNLPIAATLIPLDDLNAKRIKQLESESQALHDGIRTVRDLGNAPANLSTPAFIADRAVQVAK
ncbi:MAG TPA: M17 family peptidase N-terminal domain-containing protein, partial [Thermoanaerobaculia bacterium]|nr:M17 family peptidase N-terminal domain-containing protein [Thermoanaerobaculia bacterium]